MYTVKILFANKGKSTKQDFAVFSFKQFLKQYFVCIINDDVQSSPLAVVRNLFSIASETMVVIIIPSLLIYPYWILFNMLDFY